MLTKRRQRWIAVKLTCGHETETGIQKQWNTPVFCHTCRDTNTNIDCMRHVVKVWEYTTTICRTCRYRANRAGWDGKERGIKCANKHSGQYPDHVVQLWQSGRLLFVMTSLREQPELELVWDDEPPPF